MGDKYDVIKSFQSVLFSPTSTQELIKSKIEEIKNELSPEEIDHQLILAVSLDYSRFSILSPLLSSTDIQMHDLVHFDQQIIFLFFQANFSISQIAEFLGESKDEIFKWANHRADGFVCPLFLDSDIYDFFLGQGKINSDGSNGKNYLNFGYSDYIRYVVQRREKTPIEEAIEKDDLEQFRLLSNKDNFNFNDTIEKENQLFHYSKVTLLSYCIEKHSMKCLKFALINGADPLKKSVLTKNIQSWDSFGFAGAHDSILIAKILENQASSLSPDFVKGCVQFHQNNHLSFLARDHKADLDKYGLLYSIYYENFEAYDLIDKTNLDLSKMTDDVFISFSGKKIVHRNVLDLSIQRRFSRCFSQFQSLGSPNLPQHQIQHSYGFIFDLVPLSEADIEEITRLNLLIIHQYLLCQIDLTILR